MRCHLLLTRVVIRRVQFETGLLKWHSDDFLKKNSECQNFPKENLPGPFECQKRNFGTSSKRYSATFHPVEVWYSSTGLKVTLFSNFEIYFIFETKFEVRKGSAKLTA